MSRNSHSIAAIFEKVIDTFSQLKIIGLDQRFLMLIVFFKLDYRCKLMSKLKNDTPPLFDCLDDSGRNESYKIPGRGTVKRTQLVKEVEGGKHPAFSVYKINKVKFVRGNPDSSDDNNVND